MIASLSTVTALAADVFGAEAGGAPAAGGGGGGGGAAPMAGPAGLMPMLIQMLPIILIVVVFFWMMNRSQRKRDRERQAMLDSIQAKDDVITIGGIEGRVVRVDGDKVVLRIDPDKDVKITVARSGISRKVGTEEPK
jgi:preprotein translocase subunit YajC